SSRATLASETLTPPSVNERRAKPEGIVVLPVVLTLIDPAVRVPSILFSIVRHTLRGGMVYVRLDARLSFTPTTRGATGESVDPEFMNTTVPVRTLLVGFTNTRFVAQPPPPAKCGRVAVVEAKVVPNAATGTVVIRNSLRSFL